MAAIVPSLFGVTPQMYQQQQQDRIDAQALRFAQLDPFQQAQFSISRGANMLGGAIGGALGGQDPELQRITMRQQIAGSLDPSDLSTFQKAFAALAPTDPEGAMMVRAELEKVQMGQAKLASENALTTQRTAAAAASTAAAGRDRAQAVPTDIQVSGEIAGLRERIEVLQDTPASPGRDRALRLASGQLAELERLTAKPGEKAPAPSIKEIGVAEKTKLPVYFDAYTNEQFTIATGPDGKPIRQPYVGGVDRTTSKTTVDARPPGAPVKTKDWMDFTQNVLSKDPVMARTSTILSDAPAAIETIRLSADNDIAANALPGSLARLTGEGKNMSNADVARFARTGGLDDRLAQDVVKFFSGRTTNVKKEQAERFATALYRGALIERRKKLEAEAEQYGYLDSPNYKTALRQIDDQLAQFKLKTRGGAEKPAAASSGGLSAAEQAELDQLRSRFKGAPK